MTIIFSENGKNKWKYILIIVILAIIVAGESFLLLKHQSVPESKLPEKIIQDETVNENAYLEVNKLVQNVSDATSYADTVSADPGEKLSFQINVTAGQTGLNNVMVKDTLPSEITYLGNLKIDGVSTSGDITLKIDIGNLSSGQTKVITFDAVLADPSQFSTGTTTLVNSVLAYNSLTANSDIVKVIVNKAAGSGSTGGPTTVPTGFSNNIFLDSFFLPLTLILLIIWIFKLHIINFEELVNIRKNKYRSDKIRKILEKVRTEESLREKKKI